MRVRNHAAWFAGFAFLAMACEDDPAKPKRTVQPPPDATYTYDLVNAFPGLSFARPVDVRNAGDGSDRLFVVEQTGRVLVFPNDPGAAATSVFLDITASVAFAPRSELGLLGLVFHPQYASNGYFFVYYTTGAPGDRRSRLSRFSVSAGDPDAADPASEKILLELSQRADNHNGGGMCFDGDGYLCLGVGDEGGSGDPYDNGQDRTTLHGSILRLDVDMNVDTPPYHGIPSDNPFALNIHGYREEIFAYGLRNPWRISYDAASDVLWAGDVGQNAWEEIDIITSGANYGWDCREGAHVYTGSRSPACATAVNLVDPVFEYGHDVGSSITGGYVYRGPTATSLTGRYVYADYITGIVWALKNGSPAESEVLKDTGHFISTFGVAENGELLVAAYFGDGTPSALYRIEQTEVQP